MLYYLRLPRPRHNKLDNKNLSTCDLRFAIRREGCRKHDKLQSRDIFRLVEQRHICGSSAVALCFNLMASKTTFCSNNAASSWGNCSWAAGQGHVRAMHLCGRAGGELPVLSRAKLPSCRFQPCDVCPLFGDRPSRMLLRAKNRRANPPTLGVWGKPNLTWSLNCKLRLQGVRGSGAPPLPGGEAPPPTCNPCAI